MCGLVACGRNAGKPPLPVSSQRQGSTRKAVRALQTAFNLGPCEAVLDMAAAALRTDKQTQSWLADCQHIKESFGVWRSFDATYWSGTGTEVSVEGRARFANGDCDIQFVWDLSSETPRMDAFFLLAKTESISFPASTLRRHIDPPQLRNRKALRS
jgi:hypothetical protein